MGSLKDQLFSKPGDTGKDDCNGKRIMVGDYLKDHTGSTVKVFERDGSYLVSDTEFIYPTGYYCSLNLWLSMSETIEVLAAEGS